MVEGRLDVVVVVVVDVEVVVVDVEVVVGEVVDVIIWRLVLGLVLVVDVVGVGVVGGCLDVEVDVVGIVGVEVSVVVDVGLVVVLVVGLGIDSIFSWDPVVFFIGFNLPLAILRVSVQHLKQAHKHFIGAQHKFKLPVHTAQQHVIIRISMMITVAMLTIMVIFLCVTVPKGFISDSWKFGRASKLAKCIM